MLMCENCWSTLMMMAPLFSQVIGWSQWVSAGGNVLPSLHGDIWQYLETYLTLRPRVVHLFLNNFCFYSQVDCCAWSSWPMVLKVWSLEQQQWTWDLVRNENFPALAQKLKLWGWSPELCLPSLPGPKPHKIQLDSSLSLQKVQTFSIKTEVVTSPPSSIYGSTIESVWFCSFWCKSWIRFLNFRDLQIILLECEVWFKVGWSLSFCIYKKLPDYTDATGPWASSCSLNSLF